MNSPLNLINCTIALLLWSPIFILAWVMLP